MPKGVDPDKIETCFIEGVLTVKLPKTKEAERNEKRIIVKAA